MWDDKFPFYEEIKQREIATNYDFSNISNYSVKNGKIFIIIGLGEL